MAYAVLALEEFLGIGDQLFAIPWEALTIDTAEKRFVFNVSKELLEGTPGIRQE